MDVLESGPRQAAQPRRSVGQRLDVVAFAGRRVGTARVVALVAIVTWLAAEVLPWAHLTITATQQTVDTVIVGSSNGITLHVFDLPPAVAVLLHIGFLLLLPALALALAGPERVRRAAALVAGGFAAGLVALLVALLAATSGSTGVTDLYLRQFTLYTGDLSMLTGSRAPGMYAAVLAAVLALVSAVLAARSPAGPATTVPPWAMAPAVPGPPVPPGWPAPVAPAWPPQAPPAWAVQAAPAWPAPVAPAWPAPGAVPGTNGQVAPGSPVSAAPGSPAAAGPGIPWTAPGAPPLTWAGPEPAGPAPVDPAWRPEDPDRWRRPDPGVEREPDEPLDLTVTPIPPADHQLYLRPPR